ncbi:hypothetical protein C0989_005024 [Termitomyces sp. Mn162]|nr:hypothetical protein C0989_005024 [Termitomyces sp. Mn162]
MKEIKVCAKGDGDTAGEYVEDDDIGKVWELQGTSDPFLTAWNEPPDEQQPCFDFVLHAAAATVV